MSALHSIFAQIALLVLIIGALLFGIRYVGTEGTVSFLAATSTRQSATVAQTASTPAAVPETEVPPQPASRAATTTVKKTTVKANNAVSVTASSSYPEVTRIRNPYSTPALSFDDINVAARQALVNILCTSNGDSLRPISGSGTIIDPRGIILTNAHVAQYVLLAQSREINLSCVVRTGSPAQPRWIPHVLYIPAAWIQKHAADITSSHATGTGELDYALLYIAGTLDGTPRPTAFPALPVDTREAIGFVEDQVLAASFPAEFLGGISTQSALYPSSSIARILQLMTFGSHNVDVISVGGTIQAQAGSSGGAIVNAWGRLIGVITTTIEGMTTADRDLRATTLSYINRDLATQTGLDLDTFLGLDPASVSTDFALRELPQLAQLLLQNIYR